jgi:hypothetical protein
MTSSREAWERVLAAVEADARRAEALLQTPPEEFAERSDELDAASAPGLPADWLLPTATALPPLESMPPVPEELSDRILELQAQIVSLQEELAAALRDIPRTPGRKMVAAMAEVPAYIDRRL